ncbi:hypothetical protein L195_g006842 [Trifolium pratense]|uniref:Uncharacterized protein n=2 Tax=Trifolium pratense TaxID=57577 RepID=A0ACB0MEW3_TRIPR|nr:hypothetical protein L195_g006842 [Trifolium pratense]CAJ2679310.1 unnamed protein product [Trifolium pratense]
MFTLYFDCRKTSLAKLKISMSLRESETLPVIHPSMLRLQDSCAGFIRITGRVSDSLRLMDILSLHSCKADKSLSFQLNDDEEVMVSEAFNLCRCSHIVI